MKYRPYRCEIVGANLVFVFATQQLSIFDLGYLGKGVLSK